MPAKAKSHIYGTLPENWNIYFELFQESVTQNRILEYFPSTFPTVNNQSTAGHLHESGQGVVESIRDDKTKAWLRPGHWV